MAKACIKYLFFVFMLVFALKTNAQIGPINDSTVVGSPYTNAKDSTNVSPKKDPGIITITDKPAKKDTSSFVKHSPRKATLLSTFLPGAGQFYNKKYWKIPVIYAAGGAAVYGVIFYSKEYNSFRQAYKIRLATGTDEDSYYNRFQTATLQSNRDYYRYYRDLSYILFGAVYVLQIVDAVVDAHFYDFKITEELSMHVEPVLNFTGPQASTQLLFTFKF